MMTMMLIEVLTVNFFLSVQLEDMNMDEASEKLAVELAAQGVIGKRVDQMESGFMMALDYMIQLAENDQDNKVHKSTFITFIFVMQPSLFSEFK